MIEEDNDIMLEKYKRYAIYWRTRHYYNNHFDTTSRPGANGMINKADWEMTKKDWRHFGTERLLNAVVLRLY